VRNLVMIVLTWVSAEPFRKPNAVTGHGKKAGVDPPAELSVQHLSLDCRD
jgi:hypothetical protein